MFISEHMQAALNYIIDSKKNPEVNEINGLTLSALMSRDCVDVYVDRRCKGVCVKVKATSRGRHLAQWANTMTFTPYKDCLLERRKLIQSETRS